MLQLSNILIESVGVVCFRGKKWRENRASKYTSREEGNDRMEIYGGKLGESATTWSVGSKISPEAR